MSVTVVPDPSDTSRATTPNRLHLVLHNGRTVQECGDLAEARVWASGYIAGLAATPYLEKRRYMPCN